VISIAGWALSVGERRLRCYSWRVSAESRAKLRVLVIEDDNDLREMLEHYIRSWGHEVRLVANGTEGLRLWREFEPHLILLDITLPDLSGLDVCQRVRKDIAHRQPIIVILSGRSDEADRVAGFEAGADDYLVKPFSARELRLRMRARLSPRLLAPPRKKSGAIPKVGDGETGEDRLVVGPLEIDPRAHRVFVDGQEVHLSAVEMRLLVSLAKSRGAVCSRKKLLKEVWGYEGDDADSRTVDTHAKRLRDKLGAASALVETVRGLGYRLS
jgi:two-component system phosphate regulon response regulator PhoB